MGKRTKYQQTEHAQMFLIAESSLLKGEKNLENVKDVKKNKVIMEDLHGNVDILYPYLQHVLIKDSRTLLLC
jgi:hypothetical protein